MTKSVICVVSDLPPERRAAKAKDSSRELEESVSHGSDFCRVDVFALGSGDGFSGKCGDGGRKHGKRFDAGHRLPDGEALQTPGGSARGFEESLVYLTEAGSYNEEHEFPKEVQAGTQRL